MITIDSVIASCITKLEENTPLRDWCTNTFGRLPSLYDGSDATNPPNVGNTPFVIFERDNHMGGKGRGLDEYSLMVVCGTSTEDDEVVEIVDDEQNTEVTQTTVGTVTNASFAYRVHNAIIDQLELLSTGSEVDVELTYDDSAMSPLHMSMFLYVIRIRHVLGCTTNKYELS